jgi:acyl-CoA synthetase (NDP forming)
MPRWAGARILSEAVHSEFSHARGGGGGVWQHRVVLPEPAAAAANTTAAVHLAKPDIEGARLVIESVLAERRKVLTEMESKTLLAAFHIPVTNHHAGAQRNEAMMIATQLGFPVALKIDSPDISHKSDVQGVALNIHNGTAVRDTYTDMVQPWRACSLRPASTA